MRALQQTSLNGTLDLRLIADAPVPEPGPGEVLIRVAAAGVNFVDIAQARGIFAGGPRPPYTAGIEGVGEVVAANDTGIEAGAHVVGAAVSGGAFAEYMVLPAAVAVPVPAGWADEQALGLVVSWPTVLAALKPLGGIAAGQTVLIHAAAGGTGQTAVKIAKHNPRHRHGGDQSGLRRARARLDELDPEPEELLAPTDERARALLDGYIAAFERSNAGLLEQVLRADATLRATPFREWQAGRAMCINVLDSYVLGAAGRVADDRDSRQRPARRRGVPQGCGPRCPSRRRRGAFPHRHRRSPGDQISRARAGLDVRLPGSARRVMLIRRRPPRCS